LPCDISGYSGCGGELAVPDGGKSVASLLGRKSKASVSFIYINGTLQCKAPTTWHIKRVKRHTINHFIVILMVNGGHFLFIYIKEMPLNYSLHFFWFSSWF